MVEPTERDPGGGAEPRHRARPLLKNELEDELRRLAHVTHVAHCDLTLYAIHAAKVLTHLREVAPELVAAAELDVLSRVVR